MKPDWSHIALKTVVDEALGFMMTLSECPTLGFCFALIAL